MNIEEIKFLLENFSTEHSDIKVDLIVENDCFILNLDGVIDTYNSEPLQKTLMKFITSSNIVNLVMNLKSVNYMSSTGIGLFVTLLKECKLHDISFSIQNLQPKIKEVFDLLGFSNFFNIIENIQDVNVKKEEIFPKVIKCSSCNVSLKVPRAGRFTCKTCKSTFSVDENGNIKN